MSIPCSILSLHYKLLLSEYIVLVATFAAIHIIGIDAGIILGIFIAGGDYIVTVRSLSNCGS